jgi:hypothetical protein
MSSNLIISLATVTDVTNFDDNGSFWAVVDELGNGEELIYYTSPYASRTEGAIIAIPTQGCRILVCKPSGTDIFFYMGSTFLPDIDDLAVERTPDTTLASNDTPNPNPIMEAEPDLYAMRDRPMKMCFKGTRGNGLIISEQYEGEPQKANIKTELIGQSGKTVMLNDSPGIDSIMIKNEHEDGITVTTHPTAAGMTERAVIVETHGPQTFLNKEGQTDMIVYDGTELNILNHSTGHNKNPDEPTKYGNINIESKTHDVNVMTRKDSGRIFIECINTEGDNQVIDIETKSGSNSTIRIKSTGKLELIADGERGLDIVSGGEINMRAASNINLDSGAQINLKSNGNVNVDGAKTYLQSGQAISSNDDIQTDRVGIYENGGVLP